MLTHRPPPAEAFGLKADTVFIENAAPLLAKAPLLSSSSALKLTAEPITHSAFSPYGDLIQAYPSREAVPPGIDVTAGNGGTALKFNRLAKIEEIYPAGRLVRGGLSIGVMRQGAHHDISEGKEITVTTLERHACTTQAFIPMGKTAPSGKDQLPPGGAMIVVVALNGADDKPDVDTLKAFLVTNSQGVSYHAGIWHHGMLTVDAQSDYAVLEAQIGDGDDILDLEKYTPPTPYCSMTVPPYTGKHIPLSRPTASYHPPLASDPLPAPSPSSSAPASSSHATITVSSPQLTHPAPLTPSAFRPFGHVIQTYPDASERLPGMEVHSNPAGKAVKYTRLAPIVNNYANAGKDGDEAKTTVSVMRVTVREGLKRGEVFDVKFMERHPYTSQAFVPMGKAESKGTNDTPLPPGGSMLVIVAENGPDDRPDPKTIKSFVMESNMGVSYAPGVWHHPTIVMDQTLDLACIDTQLTTGAHGPVDPRDLELLEYEQDGLFGRIMIPVL